MNEIVLRVKTVGSREKGTLKPDIKLEVGMDMIVCEYVNGDSEAIVQIFGCEHELVNVKVKQKDLDDLAAKLGSKMVEKMDKTYSKRKQHILGVKAELFTEIDKTSKTVKLGGKNVKYKKIRKRDSRMGETIILDESEL